MLLESLSSPGVALGGGGGVVVVVAEHIHTNSTSRSDLDQQEQAQPTTHTTNTNSRTNSSPAVVPVPPPDADLKNQIVNLHPEDTILGNLQGLQAQDGQTAAETAVTVPVLPTTVTETNNNNNHISSKMADKRRYGAYERDSGYHGGGSSDAGSRSSKGGHSGAGGDDDPPNSRLFILCGRNVSEDQMREAFDRYGVIKELWIVKDKGTGESKGVAYITYTKTSEAAVAMEEMNGKYIENNTKPLKVLIANSRDQGSRRDANEEERLLRLFIIVPKSMSESDLKSHFQQFGDIERCNIVRDRNTKESKGYAYVSFHRISHAAKAFEGCDRSFKPRFADPKPPKHVDDRYSSAHGSTTGYDMHDYGVIESSYSQMLSNHHHHEPQLPPSHQHHSHSHSTPSHHHPHSPQQSAHLTIIGHGSLNQDQLWRLCDFFPGFEYCSLRIDPKTRQVIGSAIYNSASSAIHAKDKLHGFEYPPGHRLIVKLDSQQGSMVDSRHVSSARYGMNGNSAAGSVQSGSLPVVSHPVRSGSGLSPDLAGILTETIAQAQSIIQQASLQGSNHPHHLPQSHQNSSIGESYDPSYCSVKLPAPQPLAPMDSTVKERLFVVCQPSPPPLYALKDTFGRFGNLIDIFMLNGKNFGYAKYADKNSADDAMTSLHGQEVCGMRLKVFLAEPQDSAARGGGGASVSGSGGPGTQNNSSDPKCKRLRTDYSADVDLD